MSTLTRAGHINEDALTLHVLEDLPRRRVTRVKQHLASCRQCQRQMKEVENFIGALRLLAGHGRNTNGAS